MQRDLILHLLGHVVRIDNSRNCHLHLSFFFLSFFQFSLSFYEVQVADIFSTEFLEVN